MVQLTAEGLKNLESELKYLKTVRMAEISEDIKEARSHGDLSENAEYDAAKNEQARIESRIVEIEALLRDVEVIDEGSIKEGYVSIGSTVRIVCMTNQVEREVKIVGVAEANLHEGKISNESPVGAAIIDHKEGDIVDVVAPAGVIPYKILKILKNQ